MNSLLTRSVCSLAFFVCVLLAVPVMAQKNMTITADNLRSGHAIFKAQSVFPSSGGIINLTSEYDLKLSRDSIIAYLPYYGRAYTATPGEDGGIHFTSTKF